MKSLIRALAFVALAAFVVDLLITPGVHPLPIVFGRLAALMAGGVIVPHLIGRWLPLLVRATPSARGSMGGVIASACFGGIVLWWGSVLAAEAIAQHGFFCATGTMSTLICGVPLHFYCAYRAILARA
jgi:hypothetical protein